MILAKRILYSPSRFLAPDLSNFFRYDGPWTVPEVADIPMPGSIIEAGWPICTVFASGPTLEVAELKIGNRIKQIQLQLRYES